MGDYKRNPLYYPKDVKGIMLNVILIFVNYINDYLSKGPYPISHSKAYKEIYKPCYRIIHKKGVMP